MLWVNILHQNVEHFYNISLQVTIGAALLHLTNSQDSNSLQPAYLSLTFFPSRNKIPVPDIPDIPDIPSLSPPPPGVSVFGHQEPLLDNNVDAEASLLRRGKSAQDQPASVALGQQNIQQTPLLPVQPQPSRQPNPGRLQASPPQLQRGSLLSGSKFLFQPQIGSLNNVRFLRPQTPVSGPGQVSTPLTSVFDGIPIVETPLPNIEEDEDVEPLRSVPLSQRPGNPLVSSSVPSFLRQQSSGSFPFPSSPLRGGFNNPAPQFSSSFPQQPELTRPLTPALENEQINLSIPPQLQPQSSFPAIDPSAFDPSNIRQRLRSNSFPLVKPSPGSPVEQAEQELPRRLPNNNQFSGQAQLTDEDIKNIELKLNQQNSLPIENFPERQIPSSKPNDIVQRHHLSSGPSIGPIMEAVPGVGRPGTSQLDLLGQQQLNREQPLPAQPLTKNKVHPALPGPGDDIENEKCKTTFIEECHNEYEMICEETTVEREKEHCEVR